MLAIDGGESRTGDGASRRSFLRVGTLGLGGLTLSDLLRLRARASASGRGREDTAIIQVFLGGGPQPHRYLRPEARRARGVPGRIPADPDERPRHRDLRAVPAPGAGHGQTGDRPEPAPHVGRPRRGAHWVMTGFASAEPNPRGNDRPSVGSIAARVRGAGRPGMPAYVAIPHAPPFGQAAYLGPGFNPFPIDGDLLGRAQGSQPRPARRPDSRPTRRPPRPACPTRSTRASPRCLGDDGGPGPVHRRGIRDDHRPGGSQGVRPLGRRPARRATATAGPGSARRACWPAGWSRRA